MESHNPFFTQSDLFLEYPPFDRIADEHYLPAFDAGMREQLAEIAAIIDNENPPTIDNTLVALESSGQLLARVSAVFFSMASANTNDAIKRVQAEIAPRLAAHNDRIVLDGALFARIDSLYETRHNLNLDPETLRLVEETFRSFVRAGALLTDAEKEKLRAINAELADLQTRFGQNVLNEANALAVLVDSRDELDGLTAGEIQSAANIANARGEPGKFVIPLLNTTQQPSLTSLKDRTLRRRIFETSLSRGSRGGEYDNTEILTRTARLRAERAQLLGFANHAEYVLDDETAKTVAAVNGRLASIAPAAVANAAEEARDLQALVDETGDRFELAAWDWDYYADKVKRSRYEFDEAELKPYLELKNVLSNGVFFAANRIYGLSFEERFDLPVYEETVRVFEVKDSDGSTLGIFLFDPYARPSKRGGAWANRYVSQSRLLGQRAIAGNHLNIPKPPEGEPTLLTFAEVTTMFHEFGHALHSLFSNVTYPSFSGTNVPRDFVEYPSQVNEMWSTWPEVLGNYARHYETGEPMPPELLARVLKAQKFNQGYATTEYLAAAVSDQALHQLGPEDVPSAENLLEFERAALGGLGLDLPTVPPRYRLTYFSHIMSGYSAAYYSYIWSEVLDADTVEWFKENGGMTRENGQRFRDALLSRGGSAAAMGLYREFRGREPEIAPLLERRGLD